MNMTYKTQTLAKVVALMTIALSGSAFAGGNHAGGHSHDDE